MAAIRATFSGLPVVAAERRSLPAVRGTGRARVSPPSFSPCGSCGLAIGVVRD